MTVGAAPPPTLRQASVRVWHDRAIAGTQLPGVKGRKLSPVTCVCACHLRTCP